MHKQLSEKLAQLQAELSVSNTAVAKLNRERQVALVKAIKLEAQITVIKELLDTTEDTNHHGDII